MKCSLRSQLAHASVSGRYVLASARYQKPRSRASSIRRNPIHARGFHRDAAHRRFEPVSEIMQIMSEGPKARTVICYSVPAPYVARSVSTAAAPMFRPHCGGRPVFALPCTSSVAQKAVGYAKSVHFQTGIKPQNRSTTSVHQTHGHVFLTVSTTSRPPISERPPALHSTTIAGVHRAQAGLNPETVFKNRAPA